MAKRPSLTDLTSLTNSSAINTLSQNWDAIEEAFDNTLSLDGSTPNAMEADFDLNGNALLNVGTIDVENLTLNGQTVIDLATVPEWRGAWVTATSYAKNDLVKTGGNVYICLEAHTSGTFATDLTALKWELMVSKGDSGAGTGDLVSTNNLSDLTDPATARSNLNLGTAATENTVPVAKGGTGATTAADARTNLGVQASDATLTSLSGLSLVEGDILYATAADTLARLPKGTASQELRMNAGATAPEWYTPSTNGGVTLLGIIITTSGSSLSLSSLDLTPYKFIRLCFFGVSSNSSSGNLQVQGQTVVTISTIADTMRGNVDIELTNGMFSSLIGDSGTSSSTIAQARVGDTTLSTASTSVTVSLTTGAFDAGSVSVYGFS